MLSCTVLDRSIATVPAAVVARLRRVDTGRGREDLYRNPGTRQERVRDFVLHRAAVVFRIADIRIALPGVSDQTIRLALEAMRAEQYIASEGTGRAAVWRRLGQGR